MMKHSGYQRNGWLSKFFSCSTRNGIVPLEMETVLFLLHSLFFKLPKLTFPVNHTKCTFSHGQLTLLQRPSLHSPTKCSWNLVNFRVFDCLNQSSFITVIECHWVQWILLLIQQELRPEPSNRGEYKHFMHFKFKHKYEKLTFLPNFVLLDRFWTYSIKLQWNTSTQTKILCQNLEHPTRENSSSKPKYCRINEIWLKKYLTSPIAFNEKT